MNGAIFISYRRDDSPHAAGRLYDHLAQSFSRDQLFMDIDAIEPGLDFLKVIKEKVSGCEVLLAVIGPKWSAVRNEDGTRRLNDPNDFVRLESKQRLSATCALFQFSLMAPQFQRPVNYRKPFSPL